MNNFNAIALKLSISICLGGDLTLSCSQPKY